MKYYLIAGEASGDLHGSNLMKELHRADDDAQFRIWGGDLMEAAGGTLVKHYRDLAFMGFWEVARNIRTILRNIKFCKEDILRFQPDVLILIDYPGFNLRIAKWAKEQGIRVFYYISPQIWAWHTSRVHGIKASVDRMFVILPFETEFYQQYDYQVDFTGHPLLDVVDRHEPDPAFFDKHQLSADKPLVALLPGSRRQEISRMLEVMLQMVDRFPEYQFVIAGAPSQEAAFYEEIIAKTAPQQGVRLILNQTYRLLQHAQAALVTSGTATLETALFQVPQVVCYKGSPLSYFIARRLIDVKYISLVNLIVDRPLLTELIQQEMNARRLASELQKLFEEDRRQEILAGYQELRERLGQSGASAKTARLMVKYLRSE